MSNGLVVLLPQPAESALNFIGGNVVNNRMSGTIDITTAAGVPGQRAKVFNSTNQVIATSTVTTLAFDSSLYDTSGIHSNTVNNSRLTVPVGLGGVWVVYASGNWANVNTAGTRIIQININGAGSGLLTELITSSAVLGAQILPLSSVFVLNDGDFVEMVAFQTTGGNLNVNGGSGGTFLGMIKLL